MFFLLAPALALDCTGLELPACTAANDLAVLIEEVWGTPVVADDAPQVRLRTTTLYDNLLAFQQHADGVACTIDGITAGKYRIRRTIEGKWEQSGGDAGTISGDLTRSAIGGTFVGAYQGSTNGPLGDQYGLFQGGQWVGNRDTAGFIAGHYAKVAGARGIYYGYSGTCSTNTPRSLDPWFVGDLFPFYPLRIFASRPWMNPLTGVATMDAQCQSDWDALDGGPGRFGAAVTLHGLGIDAPDGRFPPGLAVVLAGSEEYVAADVASFFDYTLDASAVVDVEADGLPFTWIQNDADSLFWWGDFGPTAPLTGNNFSDCDGWTNPAGGLQIIGGQPDTSPVRTYSWSVTCDRLPTIASRTFCIENPL